MEKEIQQINIVRSYSHKLVPENHAIEGHRFAPLDFFASYGEHLPSDSSDEDIRKMSDRLYGLAKGDVERAIQETLIELRREAGLPTMPTSDELRDMKKLIEGIEKAENKGQLEDVKEAIKSQVDDLNETQLEYLRNSVRKAEAKLI